MRLAAVPSSASLSSLSSVAPSTPSGRSSSGPVSWSVRPSLRLATPAPSSRAHRRLARRDDSASALIKNLLLEPNPKALFSRIAPYVNMGATMDKDVAKLPAEERGMRVFPTMDEMHVKQVIDRLRDLKLTRHTGPDADLINYIDTSAWSDFQAQVANNDFNWMTKEYAPFFLSSKEEPLWLAMTSRQRKTIPNKEAYGPFCRTLQHHDELRKEFLEFFPEHAQDYMGREIELNALKYSQAMAQEALHFVDHASERTQKRLVAKELKEEFENLMKKFFKGSFESIDTMTRPIYSIPANGADGDFWNARTLARRIEALFAHAEPGELLFKYTQLPTATTPDFIAFLCTETGLPVPKEEFLLSQKEASNAIARAALAVHKAVPTVCTNVPKLAQHRGLFLNMTKALQERIEAFTLPVVPFAEKRMSDMAFMETLAMRTAPNQSMILLLTVFFVTAVVISIIMVHGHYPVHQETGE
ncbi:hypothetical protein CAUPRSCDRAFT_12294 [Caulochytrium protostelioides]|uniref:Uncharacterized protein n=1 Tax=Caulochytrium protostelioides TaxID=1555241 RepID=A0A4P9WUP6_9FUNG|nr:hypothetical protein CAUPRSCDRAFT_12294 [Caulochytrium protostelioides]